MLLLKNEFGNGMRLCKFKVIEICGPEGMKVWIFKYLEVW